MNEKRPTKEQVLEFIRNLAGKLGRTPSKREFEEFSKLTEFQIQKHFTSWNEAVRAAGFEPNEKNIKLDDDVLLEDWAKLVKRRGKIPTGDEYRREGKYSKASFEKHFGSWGGIPDKFREFVENKPGFEDVLALLPDGTLKNPKHSKLDDNVLLEDWAKLVKGKGKILTINEYRREGKHSPLSLTRRFGNWSGIPDKFREFVENKPGFEDVLALLPESKPLDKRPDSDAITKSNASKNPKHFKLDDRITYGNPLDFRGLRHEPVNENGVIFIFGMVANELGYSVEAIQPGFPDCEAKRRIPNGRWQRVKIEFEFESRNFKEHGHATDGCDVIVCWHHNWSDCPLEVIELKTRIQSLPALTGGQIPP